MVEFDAPQGGNMMFQCALNSLFAMDWRRFGLIGGAALLLVCLAIRPADAQTVATYDFEDGTAGGWTSFNGASAPVSTTAAFFTGTHSLLTTTNSSGASSGPSIQLTNLVPGATYQITGHLMLTSGEAATNANFTVDRQDPGCSGGTCFDTVGPFQVAVTDSAWAQIGGTYTVSMTATSMVLYAQLVGPTTTQSFYLDDVVITEIAGPPGGPQDNSGIATNFEDGALDGWSSRAGASVTNTSSDAHSGGHSLLITGRTHAFDGPQISVSNKMYNGSQYKIKVWVKLGPTATTADTLRVSLQTTLGTSTTFHTVIGNTAVPLGQWIFLSIPVYSMAFAYDPGKAFLYVESNSGTQDFLIDDFQLTFIPPPMIQTDIPSIFETLADFFPIGAEVDTSSISGVHSQLLLKHFNSIVSGNDMKWSSVEPTEGNFTFATADKEVAFAQTNKLSMRGHNLVWANGSQTPAWVFLESDGKTPLSASNPADVALLTQRIQNHIMNEVQHFGTATYVWDVVNEPLDSNQSDCLSHGPFYKVLGASYIDIALQAARQFAPAGTQLFINDFNTDQTPRLNCLIQVVKDLRSRGIPIDGVGHEAHFHVDFPAPKALFEAIETLHRHFPGLHQQITEMDISVYLSSDNTSNYGANDGTVPDSIIAEQGWLIEKYFKGFRRLKGKLDAITFWGLADDNTWLSNFPINRLDMPLPFDAGLQAKPFYWGIVDPTQLPGFGLSFALTSRTGPRDARVYTVMATNPSAETAFTTQINGISIVQLRGRPCTPTITSPSSFPASLGNIPAAGTANASFTVDFGHCSEEAEFNLLVSWSSATYHTGVLKVRERDRDHDEDHDRDHDHDHDGDRD
jgi:endo-1,4-beta-xylanase